MRRSSVVFDSVSFAYAGADPVIRDLSLHLTPGWTAIVGANGAGKSTLLGLAVGALEPTGGTITRPPRVHLCDQRTDEPSQAVVDFARSSDRLAGRWRSLLGVDAAWVDRWPSLSHGERKRLQVAAALRLEPDVLALDEPTNHLDADTAAAVSTALSAYRGVGLLVSHDRALLDARCTSTVAVIAGRWRHVALVPSEARAALADEDRARQRARDHADAEVARLTRVAHARAAIAAQAGHLRSKRHLARGDRDGRGRIDAAIVSGKDGQAGRLVRQVAQRVADAERRASAISVERRHRTGIALATQRSVRRVLADIAPQLVALGPSKQLSVPRLVLGAADRVCIAGPNGSGKSTLVRLLVDALDRAATRMVYVPQEFTAVQGRAMLDEVRSQSPAARGRLMTLVRRLGSDPERVLASAQPSPGEVRKLAIALGLDEGIEAIVLDEPTNHLDLPSIEALEGALAGSTCALVLVSHDVEFVRRLTDETWEIRDGTVGVMP